ncbi:MAG TPA: HEAT repeat domain-containing protein, partial [Planctomycetota bacterium]|nr:HEAT repeat domain-containing protein [Planctomycetota bacterium]
SDPTSRGDTRATIIGWLAAVKPDETTLRRVLLPLLESDDVAVVSAACTALGTAGGEWPVRELTEFMKRRLAKDSNPASVSFAVGTALGELRALSAIPTLIALIRADDTYATKYGLGYFALEKLTGVRYDESHDGAWWTAWWEKNKHRLPPEVARLEIPTIDLKR